MRIIYDLTVSLLGVPDKEQRGGWVLAPGCLGSKDLSRKPKGMRARAVTCLEGNSRTWRAAWFPSTGASLQGCLNASGHWTGFPTHRSHTPSLLRNAAGLDSVREGTTWRCEPPGDGGHWALVTTNLISVHSRDGASYLEIFQKWWF